MISQPRKPLAYSGVVHFGAVSAPATWSVNDDTCLMLQFVGPLNSEQMDVLDKYRNSNHTIRVQLPGRSPFLAEIVGYDKLERSFCLSIRSGG